MAEFTYTTSKLISAPVFIDSDRLKELDKILDDEFARLNKKNEELINEKVQEYARENDELSVKSQELIDDMKLRLKSSYEFREDRSLTLIFKGDKKKIVVKSFDEAIKEPNLYEEMPIGFDAELRSGDITANIRLKETGSLYISVSPEQLPESRNLFAALFNWAITVRPPKWQEFWVDISPFHWAIWIFLLWIGSTFLAGSGSPAKNFYKAQARQILQEGISQENQSKAIETLLALESGFVPQNQVIETPKWFIILLFGGFLICIILTIKPKSRIGIGKGQDSIKHWRKWIRFVFYIVPGFIFVNIIFPYLNSWFLNSP